jgi:hypothetical protein
MYLLRYPNPPCSYLYSYRLVRYLNRWFPPLPPPDVGVGEGGGGELSKPWRHGLRATHPLYLCGAGGWLAWIGGNFTSTWSFSIELFTATARTLYKKFFKTKGLLLFYCCTFWWVLAYLCDSSQEVHNCIRMISPLFINTGTSAKIPPPPPLMCLPKNWTGEPATGRGC